MIHPLSHKLVVMLPSASQTNSATRTANLDTIGADYALITLNIASALNTNQVAPTLSISEADATSVASNFVTFNSNLNTIAAATLASGGARHLAIDLRSRKRYLRLSLTTATATNDNITMGAVATLARLEQPLAAGPALGSTNDSVTVAQ
jgi:hypothetical protein